MEHIDKNQFIYKREIKVPEIKENIEKGIKAVAAHPKIVFDSFSINNVIRAITMDDGKLLVLLDDLHERYETKPKVHPKTGAPKFDRKGQMMFERVKETFQSEIYLSKEEKEAFFDLTAINKYK